MPSTAAKRQQLRHPTHRPSQTRAAGQAATAAMCCSSNGIARDPLQRRQGWPLRDTPLAHGALPQGAVSSGLSPAGPHPPHLEHLLYPLPGQVDVQLVQQLQDLADTQAAVPILVSLVKRLLQPLGPS